MLSDVDSDSSSHSVHVRVNNAVTITKTKLIATASYVRPGLIYWLKPLDSRRSKQMPGIQNLKNNVNVNVFTIVLFWWCQAYLSIKLFLNSMFSLYKLIDTVVESSLGLEVGPAAYFVFALLGGLIMNIGTHGEICGHYDFTAKIF